MAQSGCTGKCDIRGFLDEYCVTCGWFSDYSPGADMDPKDNYVDPATGDVVPVLPDVIAMAKKYS